MGRINQVLLHLKSLRALQLFQPSLYELLSKASLSQSLSERIEWLEHLLEWVRVPGDIVRTTPTHQSSLQAVRLDFLLTKLEQTPSAREVASHTLRTLLLESDPVPLFTQTGLRRRRGFAAEALDRAVFQLLPRPVNERDLSQIFGRLFDEENDVDWVRTLDAPTFQRVLDLIFNDAATRHHMITHFARASLDSLVLLGSQIASIGLSPDVRERIPSQRVGDSPFLNFNAHLLKTREAGLKGLPETAVLLAECEQHIRLCREFVRNAFHHLENHGVSVDLVYQLELLEQQLKRCDTIVQLLTPQEQNQNHPLTLFLADLIQSHFASTHLSELIHDNIHLLSRKIVERTGATGEHYITRSRSEYWEMMLSAAGGGVVTVGTAAFKFAITSLHAALFFEGLFLSLNYAISFLLMQAFHLTLATKQPSMTAPALAGKLRELKGRDQLIDFVQEIARITRSQFAAAVGNVGMVIPGCLLFDGVYQLVTHHHVLTPEYGHKVMMSFHLLQSPTIFFAMFTGVLLWMGSVSAGWVENWTVYHRLPEAIAQSRTLRKLLGREMPPRVSAWFSRNISGIAGNIFFGLYLGFAPVLGRFFGLPLDVRHVTLSAGALTFAICAQGLANVESSDLLFASLGVLTMLICNFGVSFSLALYVAMKARKIKTLWLSHLSASLWAHFRVKPLDFFFPTEKESSQKFPLS